MNYSTNYNLNKPERNEQFNLDHWNDNMDTIDSAMHTNAVNIAQNANDIAGILSNLTTNKASDSNSTYFKLMKLIYPIGSIYWSGNSTNPATLFGGTWSQIKDKFIWAKGDNDTLNATGGAKTVTLTVNNLPSHNHTFTPAGTIGVTTNPTFTGSNVTSGNQSGNPTVTVNTSHTHKIWTYANDTGRINSNTAVSPLSTNSNVQSDAQIIPTFDHYANSTTVGYYQKTKNGSSSKDILQSAGSANQSCTVSGNHTHTVKAEGTISGGAYSFTGTAGTTGSKGSGTAVDIMPPYIVKYCWQRTA